MNEGKKILRTAYRLLSHRSNSALLMDSSERYCYKPALRWDPQVEEYFVKAYGADHFARISEALTRPSCYSCIRVNTLKSTSDAVVQKISARLQEIGLPRATDDQNFGDSNVESMAGQVSKCPVPGLDYVVFIKGSGPHNIDYGPAGGKTLKEIIVSRKCAEAVLRGAQVYVPGVLACSSHVEKGDLVAVSVAVEQPVQDGGWIVGMTRGIVLQGSQADPYFLERKGLYIGQGTTMMSRAGMFRVERGIAVDMINRVYELPSFHDVLEGEIFLQNLPSIITAHALDPQPGERILDMCAAPGGKTTAIAILMKDQGEVVAADRSHNKVLDIQNLAAEMGLKCIKTYKLDALKAVRRKSESGDSPSVALGRSEPDLERKENFNSEEAMRITCATKAELRKNVKKNGVGRNNLLGARVEKSEGFPPNSFDRVLLDGPCSALGLRPRLFIGQETLLSLRNHANYQRKMFDQAVQLVRAGGVLVYSTCTINPGENEALVRYALDTYKFLSLAIQHPKVGGPGLVGCCELSDGTKEEWLRCGEENLVQRFDPSSHLDTIGFFIAKFNVGPKDC